MKSLVGDIAFFVVPSLILNVAMSSTGLRGGARFTKGLAGLGGSGGMKGGVAVLGMIGLASKNVVEAGYEVIESVVKKRFELKATQIITENQNEIKESEEGYDV